MAEAAFTEAGGRGRAVAEVLSVRRGCIYLGGHLCRGSVLEGGEQEKVIGAARLPPMCSGGGVATTLPHARANTHIQLEVPSSYVHGLPQPCRSQYAHI